VRALFAQAVCRMLHAYRLHEHDGSSTSLMAFASCGLAPNEWRRKLVLLLEHCEGSVQRASAAVPRRLVHFQVQRALQVMNVRYAEPELTLQAVASEVGLSSCHLSRLLKLETGCGFVAHLHRRRVSAAIGFLTQDGRLSVKEVAAAVGYRSVTQLDRHCKELHGMAPVSVRGGALTPRLAS
jgi:transcriptional regulator GlxA family with amidase domain